MGLSGTRKKTKIDHDPNNTTWSRKKGLGYNLLVAQGWSPGQTLGAENAAHAHRYTAGSHSHIRAILREDNIGLGARRSSEKNGTESTGLDAFQGLLGRLNGKSEETLSKEQSALKNARRLIYAEQRWGSLRFVSGGTLHGNDSAREVLASAQKLDLEGEEGAATTGPGSEQSKHAAQKALKEAKHLRKVEKAQRKVERARKKAVKMAARATPSMPDTLPQPAEPAEKMKETRASPCVEIRSTTVRTAAPHASGRQLLRQRYIKHKKMAIADTKALNEILMVKT